jgi:hypothetical protein
MTTNKEKVYKSAWYRANRERISAERKIRYRQAHPIPRAPGKSHEQTKADARQWYQEHRDQRLAEQKEYRERNQEKIKLRQKERYQRNKEQHKLKTKLWYEANKEASNAYKRRWYIANQERLLKKARTYNRSKQKETSAKRKLRRQTDPSYRIHE